jgi:hypothetical protein
MHRPIEGEQAVKKSQFCQLIWRLLEIECKKRGRASEKVKPELALVFCKKYVLDRALLFVYCLEYV